MSTEIAEPPGQQETRLDTQTILKLAGEDLSKEIVSAAVSMHISETQSTARGILDTVMGKHYGRYETPRKRRDLILSISTIDFAMPDDTVAKKRIIDLRKAIIDLLYEMHI
jgi:hypothetical protein